MKKDEFGDRMKAYESSSETRLAQALPVYIRLDGRSFSKFTKGLPRPYDPILSEMMVQTTHELAKQFKTDIAYTQSDEISLGWGASDTEFPLFSGRVQKLVSIVSSVATAKFNQLCFVRGGDYRYRAMEMLPSFDARIFQPQSRAEDPVNMELINAFLWREQDCRKNSVSMAAHSMFSHKSLQGKDRHEMVALMQEANFDYDMLPDYFKKGTYLKRETYEAKMGTEVPEQYRTDEPVIRSRIVPVVNDWETTTERLKYWFPEKD